MDERPAYYTGFMLDSGTRARLLYLFPPRFTTSIYHHVTLFMGNNPLGIVIDDIHVFGEAWNDVAHVLMVEVNGFRFRPDGVPYHLTLSYMDGIRSRDMARLIPGMTMSPLRTPIELHGCVSAERVRP